MRKATGSYRTQLSLVKLQPWFLSLRWKTCLWTELQSWFLRLELKTCHWVEHSDDDDDYDDDDDEYIVLTIFKLNNFILLFVQITKFYLFDNSLLLATIYIICNHNLCKFFREKICVTTGIRTTDLQYYVLAP